MLTLPFSFDKMIYVVASQQDLHLAQLFKIVELMGWTDLAKKCSHINFGMVLGMSTRKGTAKFLDDILRDVSEKVGYNSPYSPQHSPHIRAHEDQC
jgi:arginyl-tRNA synthetase